MLTPDQAYSFWRCGEVTSFLYEVGPYSCTITQVALTSKFWVSESSLDITPVCHRILLEVCQIKSRKVQPLHAKVNKLKWRHVLYIYMHKDLLN